MPSWVFWLVAVLIVGTGVILFGALHDRHRQRAREELLLRPPARAIPGPGGEVSPLYLSDEQAGTPPPDAPSTELSAAQRTELERQLVAATRLGHGMAAAGFVTDRASGRAVLDEPLVLLCVDPVRSLRALLPFLERPASAHVVLAPEIDPVLVRTLEVNQIQRTRRLLAVTGLDARARDEVQIATGATPVSTADLQSGWVPSTVLGRCARWVSDRRQSWVVVDAGAVTSPDRGEDPPV
ncbi:hypothetical protein [Desertihabitans aurantiacus]|uniref:hypothetical protein n=1 Tax=Desertihabitans aurantiacus TaxID=2282477 RepID=UPI000DF78F79|nr:hypothetical protein [Desertihabitans aurantiacus]